MSVTPEDCLFYGELPKGHNFKVITDVLECSLNRISFDFMEAGMCQRQTGPSNTTSPGEKDKMLFQCVFQREHFTRFHLGCAPFGRSVNAKHLRKQLKTVKKKDTLTIYILKAHPMDISFNIRPESSGGASSRCEIVTVRADEPINTKLKPPGPESYHFPRVVDSSAFQKIKKLTSYNEPIRIEMYRDEYLSFFCDSSMYTSRIIFGEQKTPEYVNYFGTNCISSIVKLPGLNRQMQFYAPKTPGIPLRIKVNAEGLGTFEVYICETEEEEEK